MSDSYYVGDWLVEPMLQRVSKDEVIKKIEPQLMAVLQQLVSRPGSVITKEHLMETVWAEVIVTENVLTRAISSLRKVLEDDRFEPKYIETISKTGYRLIADVRQTVIEKDPETFTIKLAKKPAVMVSGITLLIVLGAFVTSKIFLPSSAEKTYQPIALANYANTEYWPAISPDGKFVAYGWKGEADDNWDIYARLIGTETILRITEDPATELRARWSSDGNYIYYLRYENGGSTIYKKPVIGGEEVRVLTSPEFSTGDFDISPDGKQVVYNGRENRQSPARIKLISLETGVEKWLTNPESGYNGDIHPTFSHDGSKVAFIREKNSVSMTLWSYNLVGDDVEQITSDHISINGFDWTVDSNSLIYGSDKTGLYKLWEVDLISKKSHLLSVGDFQMVMPRVAETGRIIYAKMKDNINLWTYNLKDKIAKTWRATNDLNLNATLSPDGLKACFTTNKGANFQIWISDVDGTNAVPITDFIGQYLNTPRWSYDSKEIVFQGFSDGQSDIYKINALGGIPVNLTQSGSDDEAPFYSKSGSIFFTSNRDGESTIWKMNSEGKSISKVIGSGAYAAQVSHDESKLYYSKKDQLGLWRYDMEEGKESLLIDEFHPMYWGSFALTGDGVYYLNARNNRFEFFDFESTESTLVYQPQARIPRLGITMSLSPDLRTLLFSQIDHNDADIMMIEFDQ